MLHLKKFKNMLIYRPNGDYRNDMRGLCGIVQDEMNLDPFENYLFIFCNSRSDRIKALYWDKTGFALWYKVLEADKYKWPIHLESDVLQINVKSLENFLLGFNPWEVGHKKVNYSCV